MSRHSTTQARRGRMILADMSVTFGNGADERAYTTNGLADAVQRYLSVLGLKAALLASKDHEAVTYASFRRGEVPQIKPPAVARKSKRREAIAHSLARALAEASAPKGAKKAVIDALANQHLGAMQIHAGKIDRATVADLMKRPEVQQQYNRMHGAAADNAAANLLDLAGVARADVARADGATEHTREGTAPNEGASDYGAAQAA